MLDSLAQGIIGLALVAWSWFMPPQSAGIVVQDMVRDSTAWAVECRINLEWNKKIEQIVDAGIPLRFRYRAYENDTTFREVYRTMTFNAGNYSYTVVDSGTQGTVQRTDFPMVLFAVQALEYWSFNVPPEYRECTVEVDVLISSAPQLGRKVDISSVWGYRTLKETVLLTKGKHP